MKTGKKVVDLIYVEPPKDEATLTAEYRSGIDHWSRELKGLQEQYFENHYNSEDSDVTEVMAMRKFLNQFLQHRLTWILEKVKDPDRRLSYLKVLPPFYQKGKIKQFLLHFFQIEETEDKKGLIYSSRSEYDKEVAVLWDMYKLRKTIESINTIIKASRAESPFESQYSKKEQLDCLESLKSAFQLMFQMCIKKEYLQVLYKSISSKHVTPEALMERKGKNQFLVYPHLLKKFNYRNHFFFIYFLPGMKAKIGGKLKAFRFNYLDFEIIKQEFLVDWIQRRLKNNPAKQEVYNRYEINNKTIAKLVEESPDQEMKILKQLPINVFNDLTAEINEKVKPEEQCGISTMSENYGDVAKSKTHFNKAQQLAHYTFEKLKDFVEKKKTPPVKTKLEAQPPAKVKEPVPPPKPIKIEVPEFKIFPIKKKQIDFPYFQQSITDYKQKLALLRVKMGPSVYTKYNATINEKLNSINESSLIQRRTPKYEVVVPFHIIETKGDVITNHLVILGAEVKAKALGMGYSATGSSTKSYTAFFVYGCDQKIESLGKVKDERVGRGINFHGYDFIEPSVQKKFLELFQLIMKEGKF
ncbi:MAG: hypothetical protein GY786_12070 [Proteobacteria bacterium]|nr:hypothetical protein [Pseudomonadota bacterium]